MDASTRESGCSSTSVDDTFSLEAYRDWRGMYGWRLVNQRHYILAFSGEKYSTPEVALSAARGAKIAFAASEAAPLGEPAFSH